MTDLPVRDSTGPSAEQRGGQMMAIPMGQLPPLALRFAKHLFTQIGMGGEVLLTAWTAYAQCAEGRECTKPLYKAREDDIAWFREALLTHLHSLDDKGDAFLFTEAALIHAETGLTPRQLVEQRAELLEACKEMYWHLRSVNDPEPIADEVAENAHCMTYAWEKLTAAIAKATHGEVSDG